MYWLRAVGVYAAAAHKRNKLYILVLVNHSASIVKR